MTGGDNTPPGADRRSSGDEAARRVKVEPGDVWQPGAQAPQDKPRWVDESIFAPVLGVVLLSAVLLCGFLLVLGLLVSLAGR